MVIKNLENKIKLVGIICTAFLIGCILISVSSIWTARTMVTDAQKKGKQRVTWCVFIKLDFAYTPAEDLVPCF